MLVGRVFWIVWCLCWALFWLSAGLTGLLGAVVCWPAGLLSVPAFLVPVGIPAGRPPVHCPRCGAAPESGLSRHLQVAHRPAVELPADRTGAAAA